MCQRVKANPSGMFCPRIMLFGCDFKPPGALKSRHSQDSGVLGIQLFGSGWQKKGMASPFALPMPHGGAYICGNGTGGGGVKVRGGAVGQPRGGVAVRSFGDRMIS